MKSFNLQGRALLVMMTAVITAGVFGGAAVAQKLRTGNPTAAVYVNGNPEGKDVIRNAVYKCLDKSGKYQMVNINAINTVLIKEHIRQSDKLTTVQVADVGKKAGAEFVCMVEVQNLNRITYISATMVDVETGLGSGETGMKKWDRDMELMDFIEELIAEMLSMDIPTTGGGARASSSKPSGGSAASKGKAGTFTDSRDGQTYKTVEIGGKTWMAKNLNYKTRDAKESVCYNNAEYFCNTYGRLYRLSAVRSVCPAGFHLPYKAEWAAMLRAVGGDESAGKKLKSRSGWYGNGNGTDDYGFSGLPGGRGELWKGKFNFEEEGDYGYWWTATEDINNVMSMFFDQTVVSDKNYGRDEGVYTSAGLYSVRCVKD